MESMSCCRRNGCVTTVPWTSSQMEHYEVTSLRFVFRFYHVSRCSRVPKFGNSWPVISNVLGPSQDPKINTRRQRVHENRRDTVQLSTRSEPCVQTEEIDTDPSHLISARFGVYKLNLTSSVSVRLSITPPLHKYPMPSYRPIYPRLPAGSCGFTNGTTRGLRQRRLH